MANDTAKYETVISLTTGKRINIAQSTGIVPIKKTNGDIIGTATPSLYDQTVVTLDTASR